ncbi:hypothetical protein H0O03_03845 [Candidatus Micrarchaeota archaeon]|nr:hypothetical protein [Candidatus Micrarchaeota archaeon]
MVLLISEEFVIEASAVSAIAVALLLVFATYAATRSKFFKNVVVSAPTFYKLSRWLGFGWAGGLAFQFIEFSNVALLNKTLLTGTTIAARSALPYFALFVFSAGLFVLSRSMIKNHYTNEIKRAPALQYARGGFRGLSANDVEVLRTVKEHKGDVRKVVFETGWLEEEDVLASMKKLWALNLVRVREGKAFVTPEGSDVLLFPRSLFASGVDRKTLEEMAGAREALERGDDLHVTAACSKVLERNLKDFVIKPRLGEDAEKYFGKPLARATLGDLIAFVRDKEKDHFLGGILTTINEARKSIHDGTGRKADEAAYAYLLTEIAVKYISSTRPIAA